MTASGCASSSAAATAASSRTSTPNDRVPAEAGDEQAHSDAREAPVEHEHVAVGGQPSALAQVADEVPVQRRRVLAAGLGVRAAEREVHRAADLLVEEDRARRPVDPEVRPDAELAEEAGAGLGLERAAEGVLPGVGPRADDLAVAELELDAVDVDSLGRRAHGEANPAVGALLVRPGEDLAAGHVAPAVRVHPRAPGDAQREVRAVGLDADIPRLLEAFDE